MIRVILAPNDDLTPFDLRAQIFRVNVELSVHYRGQNFFFEKMSESDLSARKILTHDDIGPVFSPCPITTGH